MEINWNMRPIEPTCSDLSSLIGHIIRRIVACYGPYQQYKIGLRLIVLQLNFSGWSGAEAGFTKDGLHHFWSCAFR